jgi:hypothetical protein
MQRELSGVGGGGGGGGGTESTYTIRIKKINFFFLQSTRSSWTAQKASGSAYKKN